MTEDVEKLKDKILISGYISNVIYIGNFKQSCKNCLNTYRKILSHHDGIKNVQMVARALQSKRSA